MRWHYPYSTHLNNSGVQKIWKQKVFGNGLSHGTVGQFGYAFLGGLRGNAISSGSTFKVFNIAFDDPSPISGTFNLLQADSFPRQVFWLVERRPIYHCDLIEPPVGMNSHRAGFGVCLLGHYRCSDFNLGFLCLAC